MKGVENLDARWTNPIGDELKTYLRRGRTLSIRELAQRTAACARRGIQEAEYGNE